MAVDKGQRTVGVPDEFEQAMGRTQEREREAKEMRAKKKKANKGKSAA